jgi:hypothetical protein
MEFSAAILWGGRVGRAILARAPALPADDGHLASETSGVAAGLAVSVLCAPPLTAARGGRPAGTTTSTCAQISFGPRRQRPWRCAAPISSSCMLTAASWGPRHLGTLAAVGPEHSLLRSIGAWRCADRTTLRSNHVEPQWTSGSTTDTYGQPSSRRPRGRRRGRASP